MTMQTSPGAGIVPTITQAMRFRIAREHAGLDQSQLAELAGLARPTVSAIERGREPSKAMFNLWSFATGVSLEWLKTGNAPEPDNGPEGGVVHPLGLEPRTHWLRVAPSQDEGNAWFEEEAA